MRPRHRDQTGGPEHNLIQRPDLIQRLQSFLGVRQAHVAPSLNEGVQAVVIAADLTKETQSPLHTLGMPLGKVYAGGFAVVAAGGAGTFASVALQNPPGSGRILRVIAMKTTANSTIAGIVLATSVPFLTAAGSVILLDNQLMARPSFIQPVVGLVRSDNTDVTAPVLLSGFDSLSSNQYLTDFTEPIILDESDALQLKINTAATGLTAGFRWIEEPKVTRS